MGVCAHARFRPFIKVNSLIAYDNGADRITERVIVKNQGHRLNALGRRGCDGITHTLTDSSEINVDYVKKPTQKKTNVQ